MCETAEVNVLDQLRDRLHRDDLADVTITYRVAGGMPTDNRIEEELTLSGAGATARAVRNAVPEEASSSVDQAEFTAVLQLIERDVGHLTPRSAARFLPDSTVGSIAVRVGETTTTYYFLVDEEAEQAQARAATPEAPGAVDTLAAMHRRLLREKGR